MILKIWNWIIKTYKLVKDSIDLILKIVALIGIISTFLSVKGCIDQKEEKSDVVDILTSEVETFKTESGKNAAKVDNWQIKYKALERLNSETAHYNNAYLNELAEAKETINDLNIRLKDTKTYIKNELISKDSIRTEIEFINCDRIKIEPIKKKHISIDFVQVNEYLDVTYQYNANVSTVISREKDKDQFFLWRWVFPDWNYITKSVIDDPNAKIENLVDITFDK